MSAEELAAFVGEIRRLETLEGWEGAAREAVRRYAVGEAVELSAVVSLLDGVLAALERSR